MEALNANLFKFKIPSDNEETSDTSDGSEYTDEEEYMDPLANLPTKVIQRVLALENLHDKRAEIERQFKKELAILEKKYEDLYAPLYADRARIINGEREVTEEEYAGREESGVTLAEEDEESSSNDAEGIPDFWLHALQRSQLEGLIYEDDEPILKHLRDVQTERVIENDETPKLIVSFHFSPNDYFTDETVRLTVVFNPEGNGVVGVESTKINWNEGKHPGFIKTTRQLRHRTKPGVYTTKEVVEEIGSFFHLFNDVKACSHDHDHDHEEHDHDDDSHSKMMAAAEICSYIDRVVVPGAIDCYMGRVGNDDDDDDDLRPNFEYGDFEGFEEGVDDE